MSQIPHLVYRPRFAHKKIIHKGCIQPGKCQKIGCRSRQPRGIPGKAPLLSPGKAFQWRHARLPADAHVALGPGPTQHRRGASCRSAAIDMRIRRNSSRGTITTAIWKAIEQRCRTILAPGLTSLSRSLVSDQFLTSAGSTKVRRKLAKL